MSHERSLTGGTRWRILGFAAAMVAAATLALPAAPAYAQAAQMCPSSPASDGFFQQSVRALVSRTMGLRSLEANTVSDIVLPRLDRTQKQELEKALVTEIKGTLSSQFVAAREDRRAEEIENNLNRLRNAILARDRVERDHAVTSRREINRVSKPLGQIIDEEMARHAPPLVKEYGEKYREAMINALIEDHDKFIGAVSAFSKGNYWTTFGHTMDWGAQGFGVIVGDVLAEMGHSRSKTIWQEAVKRSDAAADVMRALARGDHDAAWERIKEQYQTEVKKGARAIARRAINWIATPSGSGRVPTFWVNPLPGGMTYTPADILLKIFEWTIEFTQWSGEVIRRTSGSVAGCIRAYNDYMDKPDGIHSDAYEAFSLCLVRSNYSASFEFETLARELGMRPDDAYRQFLAANRRGEANSTSMLRWITARLQAHGEAEAKRIQREIGPELTRAEEIFVNVGEAVIEATSNRMFDIAVHLFNDAQWEQVAAEISELQRKLDATLKEVEDGLDRARAEAESIGQICGEYDGHRDAAFELSLEAERVASESRRLRERVREFEHSVHSVCEAAPQTAAGNASLAAGASRLASLREAMASRLDNACSAAADIRQASGKDAARARLDEALAAAGELDELVAQVSSMADEQQRSADAAEGRPGAQQAAKLREARNNIAAMRAEADALTRRHTALRDSFHDRTARMASAYQRLGNLTPRAQELMEEVSACLRPFANAPVANAPRRTLDELRTKLTSIGGCHAGVRDSWLKGEGDPPRGDGLPPIPWNSRDIRPGALGIIYERLGSLEAICGVPEAQSAESGAEAAIGGEDAAAARTDAEQTARLMPQCVAAALGSYRDNWLDPKISVSDATCEPARNDALLAQLRDAADEGSDNARATLAQFEPIASAVGTAHSEYEAGRRALQSGDVAAARANFSSARTALDGLGGQLHCPALSENIASGLAGSGALADMPTQMESCDAGELRSAAERLMPHAGQPRVDEALRQLRERAAQIEDIGQQVAPVRAAYAAARQAGDLNAMEAHAERAIAILEPAGSGPLARCFGQRLEDARKIRSNIETLKQRLAEAETAIAQCNIDRMAAYERAFAGSSYTFMTEMAARLRDARASCERLADMERHLSSCKVDELRRAVDGIAGAAELQDLQRQLANRADAIEDIERRVTLMNTAYRASRDAGNLDGMQTHAGRGVAALEQAARGPYAACFAERLENARRIMSNIARAQPQVDAAEAAMAACDARRIGEFRREFSTRQDPFHAALAAKLQRRLDACRNEVARLNRQCAEQYGPGYTLGERSADFKTYACKPSQAVADAWCNKENKGSGWRAVNITDKGGYSCRIPRANATAWCNQNHAGSGWQAVNFTSDGQFQCRRSPEQVARDAEADCRRQLGDRFTRVVFKEDGNYDCYACDAGMVARNKRCYSPQQLAEADCRRDYGDRFSHVQARRDGSYQCQVCNTGTVARGGKCYSPQQVAEADCRRQYGNRFSHVEFKRDGSHSCQVCQTGTVARGGRCYTPQQVAEADCRQRHGNLFSHVQARRDGRYQCQVCPAGTIPRGGQCHSPQQQVAQCPQGYFWNGRQCQSIAATAGAIIGGIIGQQRQPGARQPPPTRQPSSQQSSGTSRACPAGSFRHGRNCLSNRRHSMPAPMCPRGTAVYQNYCHSIVPRR